MTTATPTQSSIERWSQMTSRDFENELEKSWKALSTLRETVTLLVQNEQITPVVGMGIIACSSGQIFGYGAFHGTPSVAELFSYGD